MTKSVVVGIHGEGHDVALACLAPDGTILHIGEEERYSRVKGSSNSLTTTWVFETLAEVGVSETDVVALAVPNIPGLARRRPRFGSRFEGPAGNLDWLNAVSEHLTNLERTTFVRHHLAHAASAAWCGPFERALVLTADGMGEFDTMSAYVFDGQRMTAVGRCEIPHSLGFAYRALSKWAGLSGVEREGKFMGLAAHGEPVHVDLIATHLVAAGDHGWPRLTEEFLAAIGERTEIDYLNRVFGCGGTQDSEGAMTSLPRRAADVAASAQVVLQRLVGDLASRLAELHNVDTLAVAGGLFMNSVLNGALRRTFGAGRFFAQPMAGDNGLALGAALAAIQPSRVGLLEDPYLGSGTGSPRRRQIEDRCRALVVSEPTDLAASVAQLLQTGELVGVCRGRSEIGSRALGHRSVLGDPTRPETGRRVNETLKHREWWRPFAVTVLEEDTPQLFGRQISSPYMMEVHELLAGQSLPAVVHADRTTRPQTVARSTGDPFLVSLLDQMGDLSGHRAVLNSSLNRNGEPIVRDWRDAIDLLLGSDLRHLVIDDYLVQKR